MELTNFKMSNLKNIREQKNITQVKLSTEIEVSQELISHYEIGQSKPNIENLIKLADYFNCSTDYLLNRTDNPMTFKYMSKQDSELNNLMRKYQELDKDDKKKVISYIDFLISNK